MPEIIINGAEGRLEGRFSPGRDVKAPAALLLHPHPQHGGTMHNKIIFNMNQVFQRHGFATLRFNFRGVGRSQGTFARGEGELADAASALDWLQATCPNAAMSWIAGFSFGAWIGMQLLMRRPEISGFISIAPPSNLFDFSFLAPCPSSGLIVHGTADEVVPSESVQKLVDKLSSQRDITVKYKSIPGANHFFTNKIEQMGNSVGAYLDEVLKAPAKAKAAS